MFLIRRRRPGEFTRFPRTKSVIKGRNAFKRLEKTGNFREFFQLKLFNRSFQNLVHLFFKRFSTYVIFVC